MSAVWACGHSSHQYNPYAERHECCDARRCCCPCSPDRYHARKIGFESVEIRRGTSLDAIVVTMNERELRMALERIAP